MKTFYYDLGNGITAEHSQMENGIHVATIFEDGYYSCGCTRATAFEAQKYIAEQTEFVETCLAKTCTKDMVYCPGYYCQDSTLCTGQCTTKKRE